MKIFWSNARFAVWSTHVDGLEPEDRHDVLAVRRTERRVAEDDAALIRDTFRRKAWVQDSEPEIKRRLPPIDFITEP